MRKNAKKRVINPKHLAFQRSEDDKVEDEPEFLSPHRTTPIRKVPRKAKYTIIREVPRQLIKRKLGIGLLLYPFIHSFIRSFNGLTPNNLMVYLTLKYLKKATFNDLCKIHNISRPLAVKYMRNLTDIGVAERFDIGGNASQGGKRQCFSLTLKGIKQIRVFEGKMAGIIENVNFKKLDEWTYDDTTGD